MSGLPHGWHTCALGDLGQWSSGGTPSRRNKDFFGGGIPWIKSGDLPDGPILFTDETISTLGLEKSAAKLMPINTICVALYGATIGKLGITTFKAATNQAVANLIPELDLVRVKYVFYFLMSARQHFVRLGQGGAQPNISQQIVRESKIPLAPLPEQQRIADKLDSLLSRVDSCRERLDRVPSILKRFRQSVLAAATSGKLTEDWREENGIDSVWELKPLSDVVSDLEQGWSPKCENHPTSNNEHWAVIKTTAIQELRFDEVENKALPTSLEPRPRFELQAGDILITRAGPRIRCGVACYVPTVRPKLMLCDKAYRFRAIEAHVRPEYVATALNAPAAVFAIDKLKTGISESGMNLTQTKFKELEIPCPSLDEQDEILRRVGDLFSFADNIDMQYQNACKRVSRLTPSLLAKAFRGQLVPQDPNDEPASVLLERIRAAKPNIKAKTSRRKAKTKAT